MKINIIGPSCVGKTTLAKVVAKKNDWKHFDLDLEFIDRDYLAETKIFRYRTKNDYTQRINTILSSNDSWLIEGIYVVEKILKEADMIIFIKLPMMVPLKWQWKRYFTDRNQRDTYGFLNNVGLTREIWGQYMRRFDQKNMDDETMNYIDKTCKVLEKYKFKLKVIDNVRTLELFRKTGSCDKL